MVKKIILAVVVIFILFSALDVILHGFILSSAYQATAELWRPADQMKMRLINLVVLISTIIFVCIYALFFAQKGIKTGVIYGILYGLAAGLSMGFCTYAVMPITRTIAFSWFIGTLVETTLAGLVLGAIIRD